MKTKNICILLLSILILSCSKKEAESDFLTLATYDLFPPFSYNGREGGYMLVGFDIELAKIIAQKLDKTLQIEVMSFGELIPTVESGKADFAMAGISISDARKTRIDFSAPYYESANATIIRKEDLPFFDNIKTKEDLGQRKKLATQSDTIGSDITREISLGRTFIEQPTWETVITELTNKTVDAVIIDRAVALSIVNENKELIIFELEFPAEPFGIVIKKGNKKLLSSINRVIYELDKTGQYSNLMQKYVYEYYSK